MTWEPDLGLAASPREWALRLHRHVADHGGARVRATILTASEALAEELDVLVLDDTTSFLSRRLVDDLHGLGRCVLGVFDPDDPRGRDELLDLGADDVIARTAPPDEFLRVLSTLAPRIRRQPRDPGGGARHRQPASAAPGASSQADGGVGSAVRLRGRGRVTAVAGVSGGTGATEVALALAAAAAAAGQASVLVDADDVAPSVAQRLCLPAYPNLRAAADAVERTGALPPSLLLQHSGTGITVLPGLARPAEWLEVDAAELVGVLAALSRHHHQVVINTGPHLEEIAVSALGSRYGLTLAALAAADHVVAVTTPTPIGIARLLDWTAALRERGNPPLAVVCNRTPAGGYRRAEVQAELARDLPGVPVLFLPEDRRVEAAGWDGAGVRRGPFRRAAGEIALHLLGAPTTAPTAVPDAPVATAASTA